MEGSDVKRLKELEEAIRRLQNAYVERFNRTYRYEILNRYIFNNLNEVK
ncbi:MAG: hypothetical protein CBB67_002885 [Alteromonadaceae bacterium TMED7]|nr:MAG: hypothetical protein CBB67_002885 [Alteromonadaceae bacterium TMED7]